MRADKDNSMNSFSEINLSLAESISQKSKAQKSKTLQDTWSTIYNSEI